MTGGQWQLNAAVRAVGVFGFTGAVKSPRVTVPAAILQSLSYGTTSGKADIFIVTTKTIATVTTATYDLYTGTDLKDINNATAALRKVKSIAIWVDENGDASGVRIGGAASQAWPAFFAAANDKHLIFPSGPPYLGGSPDGVAVGSTTNNLLIENLGAVAVTVGIAIAGTSA